MMLYAEKWLKTENGLGMSRERFERDMIESWERAERELRES